MSRDARYILKVEAPDGSPLTPTGERIWLVFTPAYGGNDPVWTDVVLPFAAFPGVELTFSVGWRERVLGRPEDGRLTVRLDLGQLKGSVLIEAMRSYFISPEWVNVVTFSGSYVRNIPCYTQVEVYSDDGTGATPSHLLYIGYQVPQRVKEFDLANGVEMKIEFIDALSFALGSVIPADVAAWAIANTVVTATTDHVYQAAWSSGGRFYGHRVAPPGREITMLLLKDVYAAVEQALVLLLRKATRKAATSLSVVGDLGSSADWKSPMDHWSMMEPDYTAAYNHNAAAPVAVGSRWIPGMVEFTSDPGVLVDGFFYTGDKPRQDQIGSWPSMKEFFADTTTGAVCKVIESAEAVSIDNAPAFGIRFRRLKAVTRAAACQLDPSELAHGPKVRQGQGFIREVTGSVPGSRGQDQTSVRVGQADAEPYSLPRTWHTLPTSWPSEERKYVIDPDTPLPPGPYTSCVIETSALNCLTLFAQTNAGGLFATSRFVRLHHHVMVDDGDASYDDTAMSTPTLPAPDPIDYYRDDPQTGDTDFGTPLLHAYLQIQDAGSTPYVAGLALIGVFGDAAIAEYEAGADLADVTLADLGNRCDATLFPDARVFIDGETWLGALPGAPLVASLEGDLLKGTAKARLEALP